MIIRSLASRHNEEWDCRDTGRIYFSLLNYSSPRLENPNDIATAWLSFHMLPFSCTYFILDNTVFRPAKHIEGVNIHGHVGAIYFRQPIYYYPT